LKTKIGMRKKQTSLFTEHVFRVVMPVRHYSTSSLTISGLVLRDHWPVLAISRNSGKDVLFLSRSLVVFRGVTLFYILSSTSDGNATISSCEKMRRLKGSAGIFADRNSKGYRKKMKTIKLKECCL